MSHEGERGPCPDCGRTMRIYTRYGHGGEVPALGQTGKWYWYWCGWAYKGCKAGGWVGPQEAKAEKGSTPGTPGPE